MTTRWKCKTLAILLCSVAAYGQPGQNQYYAGRENPLVRLGSQRVLKAINYPEWFQYPAIPNEVRQQLIDSYTTREFLLSFDQSASSSIADKWINLTQTVFDFATNLLGARQKDSAQVVQYTRGEANRVLRNDVLPTLLRARQGYENDATSPNETDYGGLNGDQIKLLDKEIAYLARQNNIPSGYRPPSSFMSPADREALQRNQEKVAQETLAPKGQTTVPVAASSQATRTIPERGNDEILDDAILVNRWLDLGNRAFSNKAEEDVFYRRHPNFSKYRQIAESRSPRSEVENDRASSAPTTIEQCRRSYRACSSACRQSGLSNAAIIAETRCLGSCNNANDACLAKIGR